MLRSFHYAAHVALRKQAAQRMLEPARLAPLVEWARFWAKGVGAAFFAAYRQSAGAAAFLPANDADLEVLMEAYLLRRAVYELGYDLDTGRTGSGFPSRDSSTWSNPRKRLTRLCQDRKAGA